MKHDSHLELFNSSLKTFDSFDIEEDSEKFVELQRGKKFIAHAMGKFLDIYSRSMFDLLRDKVEFSIYTNQDMLNMINDHEVVFKQNSKYWDVDGVIRDHIVRFGFTKKSSDIHFTDFSYQKFKDHAKDDILDEDIVVRYDLYESIDGCYFNEILDKIYTKYI